jgi:hypothetical protein
LAHGLPTEADRDKMLEVARIYDLLAEEAERAQKRR